MLMIEIIEQKRDGRELSTEQIEGFVRSYTEGEIPDYQASALLMAIYLQGMNRRETVDLTLALANSGDQLDLHDVVSFVVDKHSSGGIGDKTTLVVQPLVAACGVPVGKMSGRGLGATGGTLDKMESVSGWSSNLTLPQFKQQLNSIGLVLAGQTADLAPADGKLYALRDVTGTVGNASLIAASIMSKKLAGGADAIVLDVKMGNGAFMNSLEDARELSQLMVGIGTDAGRKTAALITDMNQPLGQAVGKALEVAEAVATLKGQGPADFWEHCLEVGDINVIDFPDRLPRARYIESVYSERSAYVAGFDAGAIGWSCVRLGAGRMKKGDPIDHAVGMVIPAKVGHYFSAGDLIATIHANDKSKLDQARQELHDAITWSDAPVKPLPHLYERVN
jgi:pyrimidine-nucleoside phosphorylase